MTKVEPAAPRVSSQRLRESSASGAFQLWLPPDRIVRMPVPAPRRAPAPLTFNAPIGVVPPTLPPKVTVPEPVLMVSECAPLIVEAKVMLPGVEEATSRPVIWMKPSLPAAGAVPPALGAAAA